MAINQQKYLGWQLGGISLENKQFVINLVRYSVQANEIQNGAPIFVQAKMLFISTEKIVLSKVSSGAEVINIECSNNEKEGIFCDLKFSSGSSIAISAREVIDFQF
jgi:hypothetical protein